MSLQLVHRLDAEEVWQCTDREVKQKSVKKLHFTFHMLDKVMCGLEKMSVCPLFL